MPDLSGMGGADGSNYELAVFGDLYSEFRFQWWSEPPAEWKPLVTIATEMIKAFLIAGGWSVEASANWPE